MHQRAREFDSGWVGSGPDDDLDRRLAEEDEGRDRSNPFVPTVLGPVAPGALGPVLAEEWLARLAGEDGERPQVARAIDGRHAVLAELEDAYAGGIRTVVSLPPDDRGGDGLTAWLAARTQMHVVRLLPDDALRGADGDVPEGWAGVAVPASNRARVGASAKWAGRVGCPLRVVAALPAEAVDATEWALAAGIEPGRLSVGGVDWSADVRACRGTLERGATVVLRAADAADAEIFARGVAELVRDGHGDRLLLSAGLSEPGDMLSRGGTRGLAWPMERLPLALMEAGLDALAVRRILVDNPARTLTMAPGER